MLTVPKQASSSGTENMWQVEMVHQVMLLIESLAGKLECYSPSDNP